MRGRRLLAAVLTAGLLGLPTVANASGLGWYVHHERDGRRQVKVDGTYWANVWYDRHALIGGPKRKNYLKWQHWRIMIDMIGPVQPCYPAGPYDYTVAKLYVHNNATGNNFHRKMILDCAVDTTGEKVQGLADTRRIHYCDYYGHCDPTTWRVVLHNVNKYGIWDKYIYMQGKILP